MPLNTETSTKSNKTEGTTQTYGQLITIPERKDVSTSKKTESHQTTVSPRDTLVKIVPNNQKSQSLGVSMELNDTDRSKISVAAFSDTKTPTVALDRDDDHGESVLEGNRLNNFSTVARNRETHALVLGSTIKSKEEIKKVLTEAKKVDMMITLKSKDSEELEFNNLKEIDPEIEFTYQFFVSDEEDISSQEDQAQDPLLKGDIFDVPRYVELTWQPVGVTERLTAEEMNDKPEIRELKRNTFAKKKGVAGFNSTNFKNSFEKHKKRMNPTKREGIEREVTDIHKLDVALESTSNKNRFSNSVNAVFNVDEQDEIINSLPVFFGKK